MEPTFDAPIETLRVLTVIAAERNRQRGLLADGTIPWDCADPDVRATLKLAVLVEEVGEVAMQLNTGQTTRAAALHLYDELTQVAAVATAWAESLAAAISRGPKREAA